MMTCPFCNIDKEKTRIIKNGKYNFVIFSNPRLMPGHLLIVPKRHVKKLSELNKKELDELINLVIEFQEKILLKIAKGCDIRQNLRPFIKQNDLKIDHLHFHLQPREFKDKLYQKCEIFQTALFEKLTEQEIKELSKILKEK